MSAELESRVVLPDVAHVVVPPGGRVLVVSDLHLGSQVSCASAAATAELVRAIEAWVGPGVLVLAGDVLELLAERVPDAAATLDAHPRFVDAVAAYAAGDGRHVVMLPGNHDGRLAWDPVAADVVRSRLGAELALACELEVHTGRAVQRIRVEHGHRFDPPNAFEDPRNPAETPLGHHIVREVFPSLLGDSSGWLEGVEDMADPVDLPAFVASRLVYRRLAPHLRWLALPFLLALLFKVPLVYALAERARPGSGPASWPFGLAALGIALTGEALLVAGILLMGSRRLWRSALTVSLGQRGGAHNEVARSTAHRLVDEGFSGLITGHTHHAELSAVGDGFYANTGCGTEVVEERKARLGLPRVFLAHRQISWIELEAGADLHVRLMHGRADVPGGSRLERLLAARPMVKPSRPVVVAAFPGGPSWPPIVGLVPHVQRVRRVAATAIAMAGLLDLASALTPPVQQRLHTIVQLIPLAVPRAAAALVALAGLGLLALARGIRRGQRHAWTFAIAMLVLSAILHVIKGGDLEETVATLAVAGFLWVKRSAFSAGFDRASVRMGLLGVTLLAGVVTAVGTSVAMVVPVSGHHLSLVQAVTAVADRLVGIHTIAVANRVDEFMRPGLALVGIGLALAAGWLVFRPVVPHRVSPTAPGTATPLERARELVRRHGAGTLSYFTLRGDKEHFFWGDSVVAYGLFGGVCLVSPDPVGPTAERDAVWAKFRRFTDSQGWSVAVLGAEEGWLPTYRAAGMHDMYVGDEGVVDCQHFSLEGGGRKGLRQAANRVAKYGYTIGFFDPAHLDPKLRLGLLDVMAQSRRGGVERGFSMTLGRAFDKADEGLLLAVCFGPDGRPAAFCQYVPAPGINGFSLDLMRRSDGDHPNGLTDFVVVETIRHLRQLGMRGLALNFATMRAIVAGESGEGITQRIERWVLRSMSDSMQIESLWRYNAKFGPDWHPRYAVYDATEHILPAALAVARAESFWELPVIGRFLVPSGAPDAAEPGAVSH